MKWSSEELYLQFESDTMRQDGLNRRHYIGRVAVVSAVDKTARTTYLRRRAGILMRLERSEELLWFIFG
jgi:hypothetical protein